MKIDGYNSKGTRTSIILDDLLFSYVAAQQGGEEEARHWVKGMMQELYVSTAGPSLTRLVTRSALALIAKPSLLRKAEEYQTDIEDFC